MNLFYIFYQFHEFILNTDIEWNLKYEKSLESVGNGVNKKCRCTRIDLFYLHFERSDVIMDYELRDLLTNFSLLVGFIRFSD